MSDQIKEIVGKKLSQIFAIPNRDFVSRDNELLLDEIVFVFESDMLRVRPVTDTDEIEVELIEDGSTPGIGAEIVLLKNLSYLEGRSLSMSWRCLNTNGYFDLFCVGLDRLRPSLMILSEGSALRLFEMNPIRKSVG